MSVVVIVVRYRVWVGFINVIEYKSDIRYHGSVERRHRTGPEEEVLGRNLGFIHSIILMINDFGRAFSAMLEWEKSIEKDLTFLTSKTKIGQTASTTEVGAPLSSEAFVWKDIIIKNKDTRGLVNSKNQSKIAYTFLDKNTILIVGDINMIGEISSIYASRSIVR